MRWDRGWIFWSASGLASSLLVTSVWGQAPVAPTGPAPVPAQAVAVPHGGPLKRAAHHTFQFLQDNWIGYPEEFIEPPLGFYIRDNFRVMKAKADPHRFTLYRSDFLAGTNRLSPNGASRLNIMIPRLRSYPGPVLIEWSPDQPGLGESRREAVVAMLQSVGAPVIPDRVILGPSPYPGLNGTEANNNYNAMINRLQQAPMNYTLTPAQSATFSSAGGGAP
ncbi:MAG: hypothetical protein U0835_23005 [Isosphaeraceae bacterium]